MSTNNLAIITCPHAGCGETWSFTPADPVQYWVRRDGTHNKITAHVVREHALTIPEVMAQISTIEHGWWHLEPVDTP